MKATKELKVTEKQDRILRVKKTLKLKLEIRPLISELAVLKKGIVSVFLDSEVLPHFIVMFDEQLRSSRKNFVMDLKKWNGKEAFSLLMLKFSKIRPTFNLINKSVENLSDIRSCANGSLIESQSDVIYSVSLQNEKIKYQLIKRRG